MSAPTGCRRTVSGSLSLPCSGFFSPFPHGTCPLSVSREYSALPDGPGGFTQDSSCPALLRWQAGDVILRVRAFHPLRGRFPAASPRNQSPSRLLLLPRPGLDRGGLGCSLFARHYWGNHCCFLLLRLLRCFSSPRSPPSSGSPLGGVAPFGHPRIKGYLRLPAAFRSLSRPSSPPGA